jgi:hypothetical protein
MFVYVAEEEWGADGKARGPAGTDQSGESSNRVALSYNLMFHVSSPRLHWCYSLVLTDLDRAVPSASCACVRESLAGPSGV